MRSVGLGSITSSFTTLGNDNIDSLLEGIKNKYKVRNSVLGRGTGHARRVPLRRASVRQPEFYEQFHFLSAFVPLVRATTIDLYTMLATGIPALWNFSTTHVGGTERSIAPRPRSTAGGKESFPPPTAQTNKAAFSAMIISTSSASFPPVSGVRGSQAPRNEARRSYAQSLFVFRAFPPSQHHRLASEMKSFRTQKRSRFS